jgi:hypothetical protein
MIPGSVSKLSETIVSLTNTVVPKTDILRVTSTATTTVLVTIRAPFPEQSGILWVINSSGAAITSTTAGNIATTCSIPNGCHSVFIYSKSSAKWHVEKTT